MKKSIYLMIFCVFVALLGGFSRYWVFDRSKLIVKEVLAKSQPFSVKLDVDFVESLDPAYEQ
jgi:hypothetical protein